VASTTLRVELLGRLEKFFKENQLWSRTHITGFAEMVTLIFFDCEFTDLSASASLISAGFITQSGGQFYAELSDYEGEACNDFVKATVLPLLSLPPISTADFVSSLTDWLNTLGGFSYATHGKNHTMP